MFRFDLKFLKDVQTAADKHLLEKGYFKKKYFNDNIILIDLFLFMYSRVIIFIVKITCHEL